MPKTKALKVQLVDRDEHPDPYRLLALAVERWHPELKGARFALFWKFDVKPDRDGKLVLGAARKASDWQREVTEYDLFIDLNRDAWDCFSEAQQLALVDHEASHFALVVDAETGATQRDDRGRVCYRLVKHDLEEFQGVVARHGFYLNDIENFYKAILEGKGKERPAGAAPAPAVGLFDAGEGKEEVA